MNAEQKQRMAHELGQWNAAMKSSCSVSDLLAISTRMSALLQELIDAPEPEPVGYTNETELDYVRKYEALPVSGVFWPTSDEDANIALYTAPPAPSVPEPAAKVLHVDGLLSNNLIDCDLPVGTLLYTAPAAPVPARLVWDAERHQWLRTYNTAPPPAVAEEKKP